MSLTKPERLIRRQILAKLTLRLGTELRRHEECQHFNPVIPHPVIQASAASQVKPGKDARP